MLLLLLPTFSNRFSIGGKRKEDEEGSETEQKPRSRNPFVGKSRVPQSQSPGPGTRSQEQRQEQRQEQGAGVGRSKSFKEPAAPPARQGGIPAPTGQRNSVYTSSLR